MTTNAPYNPITGDDLRRVVVWISEQIEAHPDSPVCAACGHGLKHHLQDRTLRSCTFPKGLGAPRSLCRCLDYEVDHGEP